MHDLRTLQTAWLTVVEFMSDRMLDPHLYFKQRYSGMVERANSIEELNDAMVELSHWMTSSGLTQSQVGLLDARLTEQGLPTFSELAGRE